MASTIRRATPEDAPECGRILYAAFQTLADHHNFPRDFPSVEAATGVFSMLVANRGFCGLVAVEDSRIAGSNFVDLRSRRSPASGRSRSIRRRRTGASGGR